MTDKTDTVRATPLQTLQSSIGQMQKGVPVDIPRGEAEVWAAMKPPLVEIAKAKPAPPPAKGK